MIAIFGKTENVSNVDGHGDRALATDTVAHQAKASVWRDERQNPLVLPALETDARMEADIFHQTRIDEAERQIGCTTKANKATLKLTH